MVYEGVKINFIKTAGGGLIPNDDFDADSMLKYKTGEVYEVDIKLVRNPQFLKKVIMFFKFCEHHWDGEKVHEYVSSKEQFDRFRKDLTILAGFYDKTTRLDGSIRLEAKSLAFGSMNEETFQECYLALTKAAMKHIFKTADDNTYNQLISFF